MMQFTKQSANPAGHEIAKSSVLEQALLLIQQDPRYVANLDYGLPRKGHPEGTIREHIRELEVNLYQVEKKLRELGVPLNSEEIATLKILIHVHDTFKKDAGKRVAIEDPTSHGSLAKAFLSGFVQDPVLLAMAHYHDVPWSLYQHSKGGFVNVDRLQKLIRDIPNQFVFQSFLVIDNITAGKVSNNQPTSVHWFIDAVRNQPRADLFDTSEILIDVANHMQSFILARKRGR